jgi:hypothetical protein
MRIWTVVWIVIVAVVAGFAAINWSILSTPTTINLVVAEVTAPLCLTLLGAIAAIALLFLLFLVWLETRALVELRHARQATPPPGEAGRGELEREVVALRAETGESMRTLFARLDRLEQIVRDEAERARERLEAQARRAS